MVALATDENNVVYRQFNSVRLLQTNSTMSGKYSVTLTYSNYTKYIFMLIPFGRLSWLISAFERTL